MGDNRFVQFDIGVVVGQDDVFGYGFQIFKLECDCFLFGNVCLSNFLILNKQDWWFIKGQQGYWWFVGLVFKFNSMVVYVCLLFGCFYVVCLLQIVSLVGWVGDGFVCVLYVFWVKLC